MSTIIDPYTLLLAFREHLLARPTHLARVFSGQACERWLQSELFAILNWSEPRLLGPTQYAQAEIGTRDILICDSDPARKLAVIELKLVYPWSRSEILEPLKQLRHQLEKMSEQEKEAGIQLHGIVFGVWERPREVHDTFDARWRALVQETFSLPCFEIEPNPGVLRILDPTNVAWPHKQWQVALSAVSIRRRG